MKIKLPENLSSVVLPEVGKLNADENGEIEVSETLGNSLSKNLGWKIIELKNDSNKTQDIKPKAGKQSESFDKDENKDLLKKDTKEEDEEQKLSEQQLKKLKVSELIEVAVAAGIEEKVIEKAVGKTKSKKVDLIKILLDVMK